MKQQADIGLVGLAVMGENLVLNMESKGLTVASTTGAHPYERTDKPRGEFFHTNWTGHGGQTASTAYVV